MKHIIIIIRAVLLILIVYGFSDTTIYAQNNIGEKINEINELKNKYFGGKMYLTYIPVNDLRSVMGDTKKVKSIEEQNGSDIVQVLGRFLYAHQISPINEAIAFIEIDLNQITAGFKKADDNDGVIKPIAWSQDEVKRIAILCDRYFKGSLNAQSIHRAISSGDTSISKAWKDIRIVHEDPYIPEKIVPLLVDLRTLIKNKPNEFDELKNSDKNLYVEIQKWEEKIDASFIKAKIPPISPQQFFKESQNPAFADLRASIAMDYSLVIQGGI